MWIDEGCVRSHKLAEVNRNVNVRAEVVLLHDFLDGEYAKSKVSIECKTVSYLPSENYQQFGLFAKTELPKGSVINAVIGLLADINDNEIVAGVNDVSILCSQNKDLQWIKLGPIAFVNGACKANVEYRPKGKLVFFVALKDINVGEEPAVFYFRHYFGRFNESCLCPHITLHGDPCPRDPEPARKRKN